MVGWTFSLPTRWISRFTVSARTLEVSQYVDCVHCVQYSHPHWIPSVELLGQLVIELLHLEIGVVLLFSSLNYLLILKRIEHTTGSSFWHSHQRWEHCRPSLPSFRVLVLICCFSSDLHCCWFLPAPLHLFIHYVWSHPICFARIALRHKKVPCSTTSESSLWWNVRKFLVVKLQNVPCGEILESFLWWHVRNFLVVKCQNFPCGEMSESSLQKNGKKYLAAR